MNRPELKVERSLSGLYWCVTLAGDRQHPLVQREHKWQAEQEMEELARTLAVASLHGLQYA